METCGRCAPGGVQMFYGCDHGAADATAWDREESDPCERGTLGCSVAHAIPGAPEECATW